MKYKIKYIFILVVMLSIVLGIQKSVTALSTSTSTFQASWNTVVSYRELLCSNEDKSFAGYTYKFQKDGGLHTSTKGKKAWILSTSVDPQAAWWHIIHNDAAHPKTQLNENAGLYEDYIANYTKPEITNLKLNSNGNVTFHLSGIEKEIKEEVHFGRIEKALIIGTKLNGTEEEVDITSNVQYGNNTINASLLKNMQKIKIKISTDHTTAEGRWQNYKAYQRYYNGSWHNIKTGSQPLAIFDGSRNYGNDLAVSSELTLKTDISMQKYITKVNGIAISSRNAYLAGSKVENIPSGTAWNKDVKSEINKISTYKDANPVTIEPGDTVTYKIIIYNNTGVKQNVTVTDSITNSMHNGKYDMEWKTEGWSITGTTDTRKQYSKTISVSANGSYTLEVEIKFNGESSSDDVSYYKNKAWISGTNGTNTTSYRTADGDFIKMKKYKVSIEKYVSGVKSTGKDGYDLISNSSSTLYNCNTTNRQNNTIYINNVKETDKVQVEIGDTITYTIIIRNTGTDSTNWGTIKVNSISDNISEYFTNIKCSNGVSYSAGNFKLNATIPVGREYKFSVTAKLTNISKESSNKSITIRNTAQINEIYNNSNQKVIDSDGNANNKDSDWIKTKTYAVSLKKYVSNVSGEETASIDTSSWETLKNYIGKDSNKYEDLKEKVKNIRREDVLSAINKSNIAQDNLIEYIKYDLNGDGKVTEEDYNIYIKENATQGTDAKQLKELIQNFIDSDLNKDNKVDNTDLMLFKQVISDVNGNGNIEEEQDIYEWDLLRIKAANRLNEDYLKKIKITILQSVLRIDSQEDTISALEYYIKSDVNDDGIVDENDNIKVYENKNNLNEEEISDFIKNNDINTDGLVNGLDIEVEVQLNDKKDDLQQYNSIKEYLKNIKSKEYDENGNLTEEYKECDVNNDGIIDILDYISQIDDSTLLEKLNQLNSIKLLLIVYDYNLDRKIDIKDYRIALELSSGTEDERSVVYLKSLINLINLDEDKFNRTINIELSDLNNENYNALRNILVAQEELRKLDYDLTGDRVLNNGDLEKAKEQSNYQVKEYLDSILNNTQNNSGINSIKINIENYMDFNKDENVNYYDKELLQNYLLCPDNIWIQIISGTRESIKEDSIVKYDITNNNEKIYNQEYDENGNLINETFANEVSQNDITICKVLQQKPYEELIDIFKNINKVDINLDGIVTAEDTQIYNQYIESCDNKEENIGKLTFYEIKKKDDDGELQKFYEDLQNRIEVDSNGLEIQWKEAGNINSDSGLDINRDGYYSDEKELVEQYMRIKENEEYNEKIKNNFDLLDLNFDGQIDENDYNICKVLSENKVYDSNMKDKINLYDITDDGKVNKEDVNVVKSLYSQLTDVEINTNDYYNYIKENMNREIFEINRADITRDYLNDSIIINEEDKDKLNEYIQEYKGNSLNTFYDITNTSANIINNLIENKDGVTLDINNDGKIDDSDIKVLDSEESSIKTIEGLTEENFNRYLNLNINDLDINDDGEINQEDIDIVSNFVNCDLNSDGFVNSTDLELFEQTTAAINNKEMENNIYEYCKMQNDKIDNWEGDRSGFVPVYQDSNYKKNRPVTVQQGDYVTYTIEVKNEGNTDVYITNILDDLPENYVTYNKETVDTINISNLGKLSAGKIITTTVTVKVTASNMCIDLIENVAQISEIKNRNSILVQDTTRKSWNNRKRWINRNRSRK